MVPQKLRNTTVELSGVARAQVIFYALDPYARVSPLFKTRQSVIHPSYNDPPTKGLHYENILAQTS
jgi:hypothetical protein